MFRIRRWVVQNNGYLESRHWTRIGAILECRSANRLVRRGMAIYRVEKLA
jgi:hypothetical protein